MFEEHRVGGIASRSQLRMSFLRWAVFTVPLILLLGFASGRAVPSGSENGWYMALQKPALTPPGIVFPIAWTSLYILIGFAVALIKPQFEAGRSEVGKGGVVRDPAVHARVCDEVAAWLTGIGWTVDGVTQSPITGPEGNVEFLIGAHLGS